MGTYYGRPMLIEDTQPNITDNPHAQRDLVLYSFCTYTALVFHCNPLEQEWVSGTWSPTGTPTLAVILHFNSTPCKRLTKRQRQQTALHCLVHLCRLWCQIPERQHNPTTQKQIHHGDSTPQSSEVGGGHFIAPPELSS